MTSQMFDMTPYNAMVGTIRTDARGLRYQVTGVGYQQGNRHVRRSVTISGRVIDRTPQEGQPGATWFDAWASEVIYVR